MAANTGSNIKMLVRVFRSRTTVLIVISNCVGECVSIILISNVKLSNVEIPFLL